MAFESNANEWENGITWFRKWVMYATQGQQALTKDSWQRFAKRNDVSIDISNMVWTAFTKGKVRELKANELMEDESMQEAWDKWCNHVRKTLGGNIIYDGF